MSMDPTSIDLSALFRDPRMFESRHAWRDAGFSVVDRSNNGKIMVASHSSVPGLLFKKYTTDISQSDQTKNYERRVEGAKRLRSFADSKHLRHVVIPHKWLLELPRPFRKEHVLVVERFDLMSDDQTKAAFYRIDPTILMDLCAMLHQFRGMDSNAKNVPFVVDGRIAFIDTEHWDRSTRKSYLHHLGDYLSGDRRKMAKKFFRQIDDGADVSIGGFDDEEDTSDSSGDFDEEEDTSSSSSSSS